MEKEYSDFLDKIGQDLAETELAKSGKDLSYLKKFAQMNPLDNSMWGNMLDGALKALEIVAISSFDIKLTAIVKLLQSWLKDKREEKARKEQEQMYGAGQSYQDSSMSYDWNINPY
jgi:hypothetical protein